MVKHWHGLTRKVVVSSPLDLFKTCPQAVSCRWSCFEQRVELNDLQRFLSTSTSLWVCGTSGFCCSDSSLGNTIKKISSLKYSKLRTSLCPKQKHWLREDKTNFKDEQKGKISFPNEWNPSIFTISKYIPSISRYNKKWRKWLVYNWRKNKLWNFFTLTFEGINCMYYILTEWRVAVLSCCFNCCSIKHASQMTARKPRSVCLVLPLLQQNEGAIESSTHQPLWQRSPCEFRVGSQGVMVVKGARKPTVEVLDCVLEASCWMQSASCVIVLTQLWKIKENSLKNLL